jgi:hypothetical protein
VGLYAVGNAFNCERSVLRCSRYSIFLEGGPSLFESWEIKRLGALRALGGSSLGLLAAW